MFRATTPIHNFYFNMDPSQFIKILITYSQGKRVVMEKTKDDLSFSSEVLDGETRYIGSYKLTQEEANLFHTCCNKPVEVQVRALDANGNAYASDIMTCKLKDVLDDRILTL